MNLLGVAPSVCVCVLKRKEKLNFEAKDQMKKHHIFWKYNNPCHLLAQTPMDIKKNRCHLGSWTYLDFSLEKKVICSTGFCFITLTRIICCRQLELQVSFLPVRLKKHPGFWMMLLLWLTSWYSNGILLPLKESDKRYVSLTIIFFNNNV